MTKLKLRMDDLRVESFATLAGKGMPRGTVRANVYSEQCTETANPDCTLAFACETYGDCTLYGSCEGTCGRTCDAGCGVSANGSCDATCETCYETACGCASDGAPVCA